LSVERPAGCPAEVTIRIDGHGIPHIRTDDEKAVWFAQGYVHARDRFFQMELARRLAAGRLAEVMGARALTSDRKMRTWRLAASARLQAALLDGESRAVLDAYAAGVNAALEKFGRWISPEIWLMGVDPEPWTPENSLAVALLLQLDLSWSMGEEFERADELTRLGRDRAVELWGWSPSEARAWIPPGDLAVESRTGDEPIRPPLSGGGSNSWALAPEKTATGRALVATDPHLGVHLPGPFSLVHLSGPGIHVVGASLPGTPGVLIGHNEHVAWSFTAAMLDDQDLFVVTLDEEGENELIDGAWLRVRTVTEQIRIRWEEDPVVLKVRMSERGPLVRDSGAQALALSWTGRSGDGIVRAVLELNRAASAADAALAWDGVIGPSLNLVAADTGGHILHQVVGLVPDRGQGAGRLPAPGADSRWGWQGFLPMARNPRSLDPENGVLATANHDFFSEGDFPMQERLPGDFASPWRVRRLRHLLEARDDWNVSSTAMLQRDVVSERAIAILKLIRPDLVAHEGPSAQALLEWDGRMDESESAPHVFSRLLLELGAEVGADEFGRPSGLETEHLMRLLAGGMSDKWWDDESTGSIETRAEVMMHALDVIDGMKIDAPWGDVHQIVFRHPLDEIPIAGRLLAGSWNRGPFSAGGDNVTVDANYWDRGQPFDVSAMPAFRLVTDVGNWDASVAAMPLGQSGRPWSSHYADQIQLWRGGGVFILPFGEAAVEAQTEARLILRPEE
jgi:penicillin amidase